MTAITKRILILFSSFLVISISCNLPFTISPVEPSRTPAAPLNATEIAQTVIAQMTNPTSATRATEPAPAVNTHTPRPTMAENTPTLPPTASPTITLTQRPCNQAAFLADVTIADGSEIQTGTGFTKTWRLQNNGSCTWTSGYHVVFVNGDRMGAPDEVPVTSGTVSYGSSVEASVFLKAPSEPGTYRGNFKLRSPEGELFGVGSGVPFYVEIVAVAPEEEAEPAAAGKPDLIILKITLNPAIPKDGEPVNVTVQTKNIGTAVSGPYEVKWWAGEGYAAPACAWNVDNSNPGGGRVLNCVYAGYPSWYPSLWTKAVIDPPNAVDESDEDNNSLRKEIRVID
ncbi:MAG: hypothetical protein GYA15_05335 [Leptolinea sp.]|jgi:hypothetical protein|nr:hypothetical protein [Leptolinea sp.]